MKNLKITISLILLLAFLLSAGLLYIKGQKTEETIESYTYTIKPVEGVSRSILARGILQCAETVPAVVGTNGRITDMMPQGTIVKKGDILFQIDDASAKENIENQEASLHTSELSLVKLNTQYDLIDFQETQTIALRKAQLDHAILEEAEELAEPKPRELRLMEIEEELAKLNLEDAQDNYDREYRLFKKDYISASALEPYEQKLENSKATLEELLLQNKLTRKGATDERRVELKMAVKRARSNMERREKHKERRINDIKAQIEAEKLNKKVIINNLEHSKLECSRAIVKATTDGVFKIRTYRDWRQGGQLREVAVGEEKNPQDVVGDVIDPKHMVVKLVVNESDYHYLKDGMDVELEMPAITNHVFKGKLQRLGAIGRDRNHVDPTAMASGDSEVSMFSAAIAFDGEGITFHPGMSSLIKIFIQRAPEGILIPRAAVDYNSDGQFTIQFADKSVQAIEGAYFNENYFEVKKGVNIGDSLLIQTTHGML